MGNKCSKHTLGFPVGSDGKESACSEGGLGSIPGWEGPLEEGMAARSSVLAWRLPGQRSLAPCSPRGRKVLDLAEHPAHAHKCKSDKPIINYNLN